MIKPAFGNSFLVQVNAVGECVINFYQNYPDVTTDANGVIMSTGKNVCELVSSVVLGNADAHALAQVLSDTLSKAAANNANQGVQTVDVRGGGVQ